MRMTVRRPTGISEIGSGISEVVTWRVNTSLFTIDESGIMTAISILPVGIYDLYVNVTSPYGHFLEASFQVHVQDTTPPEWLILPEDQVLPYSVQMFAEAEMSDLSGISRLELNNPEQFRLTATYSEQTDFAYIESIAFLNSGVYALMLTGFDANNNNISTVFLVTVEPETTPPIWILAPLNETIEYGKEYVQRLGAYDVSGIASWWINDTINFSIDEYGVVRNNTVLTPRDYPLNVTVYDTFGNSLSGTFIITVNPPKQDTTPPTWTTFYISQTIEYGQALEVSIEAWDESGIDHWWLNDTDNFILDEYGVIKNATILEPGIYRLEVRAYDSYDNYCTATLVVTVLEPPTNPTTTTTTEIGTTTSTIPTTPTLPGGMDPILTLVIGVSIGGVVALVLIIIFYMKRRHAS